jgi:hypothetical protein
LLIEAASRRGAPASLADIAAATGFPSHAHMTTAFRRVLGITPSEWVRMMVRAHPLSQLIAVPSFNEMRTSIYNNITCSTSGKGLGCAKTPFLHSQGQLRPFIRVHATPGYPPKLAVKAEVADQQPRLTRRHFSVVV